MAVSKKTRFAVFTRDDFTCQYCGKRPPDTVLEVDHITPRSRGGTDNIDNLATSCFDCNRGKAASFADEIIEGLDVQLQSEVARVQDRLEKHALRQKLRELEQELSLQDEDLKGELIEYWLNHWIGGPPRYYDASSLPYFIHRLPLPEIKEAMDIAAWKPRSNYWAYFCGICHTKIRQGKGTENGGS